ncbi:hypothetical protein TNCV_382731 [Trichonephila clavipes]|nr:hypothetical protein TNCV_382731 [Trichonephila clavipes]
MAFAVCAPPSLKLDSVVGGSTLEFHVYVYSMCPNMLLRCQRFGHSKTVCRGQPTCSRCAEVGHDSADCKAKERCVNCGKRGPFIKFSRSCPTWLLEKEITTVKIKDKISYPEARRVVSSACQFLKKLCVGNQQIIRINSHSSRRKYGPNICTVRFCNTEECCRGYTSVCILHAMLKNRKSTHQGIRGCNPTKKEVEPPKNSMTWETMSWKSRLTKATRV